MSYSRGPRKSVATGGRAPGVGRSAAAAEIYENEVTTKVAAENVRRCKRILEFVKEAVEKNDPNITPDDALYGRTTTSIALDLY